MIIGHFRINEDFLLQELGNVTAAKCIQGKNGSGHRVSFSSTKNITDVIFSDLNSLQVCGALHQDSG